MSLSASELRSQAEAAYRSSREQDDAPHEAFLPESTRRALHELRVHQIELEMQNEELRRLQLELQVGRTRYFDLYDLAPVGYCTLDASGGILQANLTAATLMGVARGGLIGQSLTRFIAAGDQDTFYLHRQALLSGVVSGSCDLLIVRQDGAQRWVRLISAAAREADGMTVLRSVLDDITSRVLAESGQRVAEHALRAVSQGVLISGPDRRIVSINEAFSLITGYDRAETLGRNCSFLQGPLTDAATVATMRQALAEGTAFNGEILNYHKDGHTFWNDLSISPVRDEQGRLTHFIGITRDITAKKAAEAELLTHRDHLGVLVARRTAELTAARRQAESANDAKSRFLANMSHEIRTPMNAILGLTGLMRRDGAVTSGQLARLDKVHAAGQHLMSMLNDILDLSKIEAGELRLEDNEVDLAALFGEVRAMVADAARAKGLSIDVQVDAPPGPLRGDATRLRQALLNLASNAVKFTQRGGVVLLARVMARDAGEVLLRFEVTDTGIGISPQGMDRLFDAFQQADASTTREYGGSGLGLSITRRLAQLMGGEAGADSVEGTGSTFWFTARLRTTALPAAPPVAEAASAEQCLRELHAGARILLVEDHPINRDIVIDLLQWVGLSVDIATNGREAVEQACARPYDLVLMDMQMPEMDGLASTRAIRALPGWATIPVLALTANAFDEDRSACLAAGMNDVIVKPMAPEVLYEKLGQWLPVRLREGLPGLQ